VPDEHLPVAAGTRADPDRRDLESRGDPRRHGSRHRLQHDSEATGVLQRESLVVQRQRRFGSAPLSPEPTELRRRLRRQPDVAHHADRRLGYRASP